MLNMYKEQNLIFPRLLNLPGIYNTAFIGTDGDNNCKHCLSINQIRALQSVS